jgi:hypothetical protein
MTVVYVLLFLFWTIWASYIDEVSTWAMDPGDFGCAAEFAGFCRPGCAATSEGCSDSWHGDHTVEGELGGQGEVCCDATPTCHDAYSNPMVVGQSANCGVFTAENDQSVGAISSGASQHEYSCCETNTTFAANQGDCATCCAELGDLMGSAGTAMFLGMGPQNILAAVLCIVFASIVTCRCCCETSSHLLLLGSNVFGLFIAILALIGSMNWTADSDDFRGSACRMQLGIEKDEMDESESSGGEVVHFIIRAIVIGLCYMRMKEVKEGGGGYEDDSG